MKKRIINLLAFLLLGNIVSAQNFTHSLDLPVTDTAGYCTIKLPPYIFSACKSRCEDIRLFEKGNPEQVPFSLEQNNEAARYNKWVVIDIPFKMMEQTAKQTVIEIPAFEKLHGEKIFFYGQIKNTTTSKHIIKYKQIGHVENEYDAARVYTDSGFYVNSGALGIDEALVIRIENYDNNFKLEKLVLFREIEVINPEYSIKGVEYKVSYDSVNKTTIINGALPYKTPLTAISIETTGERNIDYVGVLKLANKESQPLFSRNRKNNFDISFNNGVAISYLDGAVAQEFNIVINNKDNPAPVISSISFFSPEVTLRARLEKGKQYELKMGDPDLDKPNYYNDNALYGLLPELTATAPLTEIASAKTTSHSDTFLLWGSIALCVLVMGGMALSMIKRTTA